MTLHEERVLAIRVALDQLDSALEIYGDDEAIGLLGVFENDLNKVLKFGWGSLSARESA